MLTPQIWEDRPESTIAASGWTLEPYGDASYLEAIEHYAELAKDAREKGAALISLRGMPGLHEARAAVLGARTVGLPIAVSLRWDDQEQEELLAALICLQSLGVAFFGLDADRVSADLIDGCAALYPYADVPLLVRLGTAVPPERLHALIHSGVSLLAGKVDRQQLPSTPVPERPSRCEDSPLLLADESGVYYIEEDFTRSAPIECERDMLDDILEQEEMGFDALCFHIKSVDDAHFLGQNVHMARCAVSLLAEDAACLEMALTMYSGRALIDARSDVEDGEMDALAAAYGAIVR